MTPDPANPRRRPKPGGRAPRARGLLLPLAALLLAAACGGGGDPRGPARGHDGAPDPSTGRRLTLLLTTDEHGWLEPFADPVSGRLLGGVQQAYRQLRQDGGLGRPGVVLLSAGDMWTGPFESTALAGAPMLEAFNRMAYDAAVIGNHDFDFGVSELARRVKEARFPLLAANIARRENGRRPDWATPSALIETGGWRIGVVGLTHRDTPRLTDPRNVAALEFLPYEPALRRESAELRRRGAELVVALLHLELDLVAELAPVLRELRIPVAGTGHAHRPGSLVDDNRTPDDPRDDLVLCNPGPYMRSYCRIDLEFVAGELSGREVSIHPIARDPGSRTHADDLELEAIVRRAHASVGKLGAEPLGRLDAAVEPARLGRRLVESWLRYVPGAEVAVTNRGGLRQPLGPGEVRLRDVISVLPFDNTLVVVELDGSQLREVLAHPGSIAAGVTYQVRETARGREVVGLADRLGPVGDDRRLIVVVHDFMYLGGDGYDLARFDPSPDWTAIDWRKPLIEELRAERDAPPPAVPAPR